jgi:hypothetical protein
MKNLIVIIVFFTTLASINAQGMHKPHEHMREKYRQLEKLKLLETLQLDEETAIRFFSRRNEFFNEQKAILNKRKKLIEKAENMLNGKNGDYNSIIDGIKNIEKELLEKRTSFLDSIKDILTKEQIIKMIIFDYRFKQEIRDVLMKRGKRKYLKR